ncbi:hypothetical protein [Salininema proteolyticum]|uniref:DUF3137 domain-containing protein n=1 Tax=Salininema proteolyticum TaxID=1607685 RepID=A0ABV8U172_9ACTN
MYLELGPWGTPLYILVLLVVAGGGFWLWRRRSRQKSGLQSELDSAAARLPSEAHRRGWSYEPRNDAANQIVAFRDAEVDRHAGPPQPGQPPDPRGADGNRRGGRGVLQGVFHLNPTARAEHVMNFQGRFGPCTVFQHGHNESTRERDRLVYVADPVERAKYVSVFAVRLPRAMPYVSVFRRSGIDLQSLDVRVENHRFNEDFFVFGDQRRYTIDIVHPQFVEWAVANDFPKGTYLVIAGGWCVMAYEGVLDPDGIDQRLRLLDEFRSLVPEHTWRTDYSGRN